MAWYILEHPQWDAHGRESARAILDWTLATFGTNRWAGYGVTPILARPDRMAERKR